MPWPVPTTILAALLSLGLLACGGNSSADTGLHPAVVRVGTARVDKQLVDHWTSVIARGGPIANPTGSRQGSPRQQALAFLIDANWTLGEATAQGLKISNAQVAQRAHEQWESVPDSHAELQAALKTNGETFADLEFEAKAMWAGAAVRELLSRRIDTLARASVTPATVASYYKRHLSMFRYPEKRRYDIIEGLASVAAGRALAKRIGSGRRFRERGGQEDWPRPKRFVGALGKAAILRAIFSAKPGVVSDTMPLSHRFAMFVVRHITPPGLTPFTAARSIAESKLLVQSKRQVSDRLIADYRARWIARTDCQPGYIVPRCRQYVGAPVPETAAFLGAGGSQQ